LGACARARIGKLTSRAFGRRAIPTPAGRAQPLCRTLSRAWVMRRPIDARRWLGAADRRTPPCSLDGKSARSPGRIRIPVRDATVWPVGPIQRRARIAIGARWRTNVSPYAPVVTTMADLSAFSVQTPLCLRHPAEVCGIRDRNDRAAQGRACKEARNQLLHCNPRYGESDGANFT
jgi:hypothetical protein